MSFVIAAITQAVAGLLSGSLPMHTLYVLSIDLASHLRFLKRWCTTAISVYRRCVASPRSRFRCSVGARRDSESRKFLSGARWLNYSRKDRIAYWLLTYIKVLYSKLERRLSRLRLWWVLFCIPNRTLLNRPRSLFHNRPLPCTRLSWCFSIRVRTISKPHFASLRSTGYLLSYTS